MDPELKQAFTDLHTQFTHLQTQFTHLQTQFTHLQTQIGHVDEQLESVSRHVDERFESISRHVDERFESISRHFEERLENTETKLLTAFHNWAQTYESRARGTITLVHQFEERLGFVEERLNKLERARNGQTNPGGPKS